MNAVEIKQKFIRITIFFFMHAFMSVVFSFKVFKCQTVGELNRLKLKCSETNSSK